MAGIGKKRQTDADVFASIPQSAWSNEARVSARVWEVGQIGAAASDDQPDGPELSEVDLPGYTSGQLDRFASVVLGRTVGGGA